MIGKRPVNQVEIEIIELQIFQGFFARWDYIALSVLVVPEFRGDPDFVTTESVLEEFLKYVTNPILVAIDRSAVKVAIPD
jgi:hypothetical protein